MYEFRAARNEFSDIPISVLDFCLFILEGKLPNRRVDLRYKKGLKQTIFTLTHDS